MFEQVLLLVSLGEGGPGVFEPSTLPVPLQAMLEQVRAWHREPPAAVTAEERASWVAGLQQLRDAVDAVALAAVASFDAAGDGEVLAGAASTAAWLRGAVGATGGQAAERVRLARAARTLLAPAVEQLAAGDLTYEHLRAIEHAVRPLPAEHQADAAAVLTDLATGHSVTDVRTAGRHLRYVTDPDGTLSDAEQQFGRRRLTLSPMMDGMTAVDGLLDAEAAALLAAAFEPFLVPTGPGDTRTAAQRRADALLEITRAACDHRLLPQIAGERPHLHLLWPATPDSPATLPQTPGGGALLHPTSAARLACDAAVTNFVLSPEGVPINLGRTTRLFTPSQRRLLTIRDHGCRFPHCDRPPAFTDAHHVHSWLDGGATDLPNGLLLCRHHHRLVHEGRWTITTGPDGTNGPTTFTGPTGHSLTSHPHPGHDPTRP